MLVLLRVKKDEKNKKSLFSLKYWFIFAPASAIESKHADWKKINFLNFFTEKFAQNKNCDYLCSPLARERKGKDLRESKSNRKTSHLLMEI